MKKIFIFVAVVVLVVSLLVSIKRNISNNAVVSVVSDPKNLTYIISGDPVTLVRGLDQGPVAADSSSMITTRYFGNEARGDIDGDGDEDVAFLLTQDGGGSGIFFYLVAALKESDGYRGSHAMFIGDRIAPQTTSYENGLVVVNYADRTQDEAMAAVPSVGKSLYAKYDPITNSFGEVVRDFEGEADPGRMSLDMKTWRWIQASYNDGRIVLPKKSDLFTITFQKNGSFSASTDCNSFGGTYVSDKGMIVFRDVVTTTMYCDGSQEQEFMALLNNTSGYHFTSKGELLLDLKFDSGTVLFR